MGGRAEDCAIARQSSRMVSDGVAASSAQCNIFESVQKLRRAHEKERKTAAKERTSEQNLMLQMSEMAWNVAMHRLQGPGSSSGGQRIAVLPEPDRSCAPKGRGRAQARSRAASRSRTPIRRRAPSRSRSRASSNLRRPRRRGRSRTRSRAPAADDGQPRSKALARGPSQQGGG